jgi:hypothetical protein
MELDKKAYQRMSIERERITVRMARIDYQMSLYADAAVKATAEYVELRKSLELLERDSLN